MEPASIVPAVPSRIPAPAPEPVPVWRIRQILFLNNVEYVGVQPAWGTLPDDIVLFRAPSGNTNKAALPSLHPEERAALEREAGRPFVSDEAAHGYRLRRIQSQAVADLLNEKEAAR